MDVDNDLYPPDIEVVTPAARHARNRAAMGTFLVTVGTGLLLERIVGRDLDLFWLGVGFALIAAWLQAPQFRLFAVGAVITGMGIGGFLESAMSMPFETTIASLCSAAGFFAVFVRYPQRAKWALIPAAVILAFGALAGAISVIGLVPAALGSLGAPGLLIAGGVLLLMRNTLPSTAVKVGTVVIGILLITSLVSTVDSWDGSRIGDGEPPVEVVRGVNLFDPERARVETTADLPDLDGRTLVIETHDGAIRLDTTSVGDGSVLVSGGDRRSSIAIEESDDTVTVSWSGTDADEVELVVTAAEGSRVHAVTDGGSINATVEDGDFTLESDAGDVTVLVEDRRATIDAESEGGTVFVDDREEGERFRTGSAAEEDTTVTVRTEGGPISILGLAA